MPSRAYLCPLPLSFLLVIHHCLLRGSRLRLLNVLTLLTSLWFPLHVCQSQFVHAPSLIAGGHLESRRTYSLEHGLCIQHTNRRMMLKVIQNRFDWLTQFHYCPHISRLNLRVSPPKRETYPQAQLSNSSSSIMDCTHHWKRMSAQPLSLISKADINAYWLTTPKVIHAIPKDNDRLWLCSLEGWAVDRRHVAWPYQLYSHPSLSLSQVDDCENP